MGGILDLDLMKQSLQGEGRLKVPSVGANVNAGEHNLLKVSLFQDSEMSDDPLRREASRRPSRTGNDAVRAASIASILNFEKGAGMAMKRMDRSFRKSLLIPDIAYLYRWN